MEMITLIRDFIAAYKAGDATAARKAFGKLLFLIGNALSGTVALACLPEHREELTAATEEVKALADAPEPALASADAGAGANGAFLKKLLALLAQLLPLFL